MCINLIQKLTKKFEEILQFCHIELSNYRTIEQSHYQTIALSNNLTTELSNYRNIELSKAFQNYRTIKLLIYRKIELSNDQAIDISKYQPIELSYYRTIKQLIYRNIELSNYLAIELSNYRKHFKTFSNRNAKMYSNHLNRQCVNNYKYIISTVIVVYINTTKTNLHFYFDCNQSFKQQRHINMLTKLSIKIFYLLTCKLAIRIMHVLNKSFLHCIDIFADNYT